MYQDKNTNMKIAVLADIHANFPALQTVADHIKRWQPDHVIVAGDTVNRGPRSLDCLKFVQEKQQTQGWQIVRGNHEDYVLAYDEVDAVTGSLEFEIFRCAYWSYQQINGHIAALKAMPFQASKFASNGEEARVVHASMLGTRNGIFPKTPDEELRRKINPSPAVLVVGHTHIPLVRCIDETLVVNAGAVGLPFDGDTRASYAQISRQNERWSAKIIRLPYDRQQAEQDFYKTGFLHEGGPLARLILNELHTAHSRLHQWMVEYYQPTLAGKISLEDSATELLEKVS